MVMQRLAAGGGGKVFEGRALGSCLDLSALNVDE
jgi:hypothetical protein